ncbi:hypothetical protein D3C80_824780 [compost metagenome]
MQARNRQARVKRQVTSPRLEAADDHAQQRQVAFGQQCHRLIDRHPGGDQRMAQAVGLAVELGIAQRLLQAPRNHPLRVRGNPCFEQFGVTLLKTVGLLAAVAVVEQKVPLGFTEQRQLADIPLEALGQRQQQTLELGQQALDRGGIEVTLVEGQVQPQVIARIADGGQREVGMGAPGIGAGVQALCTVQHGNFHRRVLEHEQTVEQRLALGQLAALLDAHQRQVFVLAQLHVALEQALQPLAHAAALARCGQFHPQGNTVDEQPDGALHLRHAHRATGHRNAEDHVALAAVAAQHQGPGGLRKGIDGQLMGLGQLTQAGAIGGIEAGVAIADQHPGILYRVVTQQWPVAGHCGTALKAFEVSAPPLARLVQVLMLQPADVVAVARRHRQLRLTALAHGQVDLEEVIHQQRTAPGIDKDVVVAHHEPVAVLAHPHQAQVERRLPEQVETGFALLLVQRLQARFLFSVRDG